MKIAKLVGCGNDFIISEDKNWLKIKNPRDFVKKICQRKFSVGADGFLYLEKQQDKYKWYFFNADGSDAEMCGNAARCVGRYLYEEYQLEEATIQTLSGDIHINKYKDDFKIKMTSTDSVKEITKDIYYINTGVPHIVCDSFGQSDEQALIKKYRSFNHGSNTNGSNISFFQHKKEKIQAKTFERGVENFTLACGTGALAVASVIFYKNKNQNLVEIQMPGGALKVSKESDGLHLIGPADYIYKGHYVNK